MAEYLKLYMNALTLPGSCAEVAVLCAYVEHRLKSSRENPKDFCDENGRFFVYCSVERAASLLGCKRRKAERVFRDAEKLRWMERKVVHVGEPARIYLLRSFDEDAQASLEENPRGISHDYAEELVKAQIEYDELIVNYEQDKQLIDAIVDVMVGMSTCQKPFVYINKEQHATDEVQQMYERVSSVDVEYILDRTRAFGSTPDHLFAYLRTVIYNAPLTRDEYYENRVRDDFKGGVPYESD